MLPFIEIKMDEIRLSSEQLVLKKAEYQNYLTAAELVEAAEAEAQEIALSAQAVFEQQRALGWEAGIEEARIKQAAAIQETLYQCHQYYKQVERQVAQVVLQAVRKILHDYDDIELTLSVVREAFSLVSNQKHVILHVQPDQVTGVREQIARVLKDYPEIGYVEVIADARLDHGGCILETEVGIIDASIEGQLAALASGLSAGNSEAKVQRQESCQPNDKPELSEE